MNTKTKTIIFLLVLVARVALVLGSSSCDGADGCVGAAVPTQSTQGADVAHRSPFVKGSEWQGVLACNSHPQIQTSLLVKEKTAPLSEGGAHAMEALATLWFGEDEEALLAMTGTYDTLSRRVLFEAKKWDVAPGRDINVPLSMLNMEGRLVADYTAFFGTACDEPFTLSAYNERFILEYSPPDLADRFLFDIKWEKLSRDFSIQLTNAHTRQVYWALVNSTAPPGITRPLSFVRKTLAYAILGKRPNILHLSAGFHSRPDGDSEDADMALLLDHSMPTLTRKKLFNRLAQDDRPKTLNDSLLLSVSYQTEFDSEYFVFQLLPQPTADERQQLLDFVSESFLWKTRPCTTASTSWSRRCALNSTRESHASFEMWKGWMK